MRDDLNSLNLADLDVEQLEQRIELGHLHPGYGQNRHTDCDGNHCITYDEKGNRCTINYCEDYRVQYVPTRPHL